MATEGRPTMGFQSRKEQGINPSIRTHTLRRNIHVRNADCNAEKNSSIFYDGRTDRRRKKEPPSRRTRTDTLHSLPTNVSILTTHHYYIHPVLHPSIHTYIQSNPFQFATCISFLPIYRHIRTHEHTKHQKTHKNSYFRKMLTDTHIYIY